MIIRVRQNSFKLASKLRRPWSIICRHFSKENGTKMKKKSLTIAALFNGCFPRKRRLIRSNARSVSRRSDGTGIQIIVWSICSLKLMGRGIMGWTTPSEGIETTDERRVIFEAGMRENEIRSKNNFSIK